MPKGNPNPSPATRFQKGRSGNPGGRPKTRPLTDALFKELRGKVRGGKQSHLELVAWKWVQLAIAGDMAAIRALADRIEGTPAQTHEISGLNAGPIEFTIDILRPVDGSDDPA